MSSPVLTPNNSVLLIAAISSRPYVEAAVRAGYQVIALDVFNDQETRRLARQSFCIPMHDKGLDERYLMKILSDLPLDNVLGCCLGAGFEAQPDVLTELENYCPVIGCHAQTIRMLKSPEVFFDLCDEIGMLYPEVQWNRPMHTQGWLIKHIGGSGGGHVQHLDTSKIEHHQDVYYQRWQAGNSMSCLFLATEKEVNIIGFNEQWTMPHENNPFRYGGAVSHVPVSDDLKIKMHRFLERIVLKTGFKGIGSCDFIYHEGRPYILEINPRLSATMELYETSTGALFSSHVRACTRQHIESFSSKETHSKAMHVVYAEADKNYHDDWPSWVKDIPHEVGRFAVGMPVCTVHASESNYWQAKNLVKERAMLLASM